MLAGAGIGALAAAIDPLSAFAGSAAGSGSSSSVGIDVRDYGAAGDGRKDDAPAIQAALDATEARGGTVYIPAGQYRIGRTLQLPSGTTVRGDGRASSVITPVPRTGPETLLGHKKTPRSNPSASDVSVQDLGLVGDGRTLRGLLIQGLSRSSFSRLKISGLSRPGAIGLDVTGWRDGSAYRNSADNNYYSLEVAGCHAGVRLTKAPGDPATYGPSFQNFYGLRISGYTTIGFNLDWGEGVTAVAARCTTAVNRAVHIRLNDDVPTLVAPTTDCASGTGQVGIRITPGCTSALILNPLGDMGRRKSNKRIDNRGSQTIVVRHPFTTAPRRFLNNGGGSGKASRRRCRRRTHR